MTDGSAGAESYVAIIELSAEISRAWNGDAFTAAVAMVYVGMDTMALLSCLCGLDAGASPIKMLSTMIVALTTKPPRYGAR